MHKLFTGDTAADAGRHLRWDLQIFAGEGASSGGEGGGDGSSSTGVQSADAGQNGTMDNLGIPKEKLERYKKRKQTESKPVERATEAVEPAPETAPAEEAPKAEDQKDPDAEWKKALENPEFNQRIQAIVGERVKKMQGVLDALTPALETLGQKYGFDVSDITKMDFAALSKKISEDDSYFEDKAEEMGASTETARRVFQAELAEKRQSMTAQEEMMQRHFADLERQGEILKQKIPNFDLRKEMEDARFRRMVAPGGGWNVEQAFNAIHHDALVQMAQEQAAQRASQALANSVASGRNIPAENGSVQRGAENVRPKLYSQMTPEERAEYKARITGKQPFGR